MAKSKTKSIAATVASTSNTTTANLPMLSQAIKTALAVGKKVDSSFSHNQVLDAIAKELGFKSFRALKAAEQPIGEDETLHPLLAAYSQFSQRHPSLSLELSVPMRPTEGTDLPAFKFALTQNHLEKVVQMAKTSQQLKSVVEVHVGGLPAGREGTSVALAVAHTTGNDDDTVWMGFHTVTYHKYDQEVSGSQGDLPVEDLTIAIEDAASEDLSTLAVGQHRVLDHYTVLYRVDESTIRLACEFTNTVDYLMHGVYPTDEDGISLEGYTGVSPLEALDGFPAAVIAEGVLTGEHHSEG